MDQAWKQDARTVMGFYKAFESVNGSLIDLKEMIERAKTEGGILSVDRYAREDGQVMWLLPPEVVLPYLNAELEQKKILNVKLQQKMELILKVIKE